MTSYTKRLIEVDLPIKRISEHARREKSIRHGHISTLHIWWARRPLAACRAVLCASLWLDPADPNCPQAFRESARDQMLKFADRLITSGDLHRTSSPHTFGRMNALAKRDPILDINEPEHLIVLRNSLLDFIADFANWDNSAEATYLEIAHALTQSAHEVLGGIPGSRPLVVDPFAGGGAIPLEALRVGADTFASDVNPVAVLLNKVVLEYIPRYGQQLADEVQKWGNWIKEEAKKQLAEYYPEDEDGAMPIAYLWSRTIICEGPGCGCEIPLMRSFWLAKRRSRSIKLKLIPNIQSKHIGFEIVYDSNVKDIEGGTVQRGAAICPCCGYITPVERVRAQLKARDGGTSDARMIAVVTVRKGEQGRFYRLPLERDLNASAAAAAELKRRKDNHHGVLSLIPDEKFTGLEPRRISLPQYGINGFEELFAPRQHLAITTLSSLVSQVTDHSETNNDLMNAVQAFLAINVDRQADKLSSLARWDNTRENPQGTFARQALAMVWDFQECNPLSGSGGDWDTALNWVVGVIQHVASSIADTFSGHAEIASATHHILPDDSADALFTDPPYYYSVPYADLSDFFYVWLKRSIGTTYPELFKTPLTPKDEEAIQNLPHSEVEHLQKDRVYYEKSMLQALSEARRITRPDGIGTIVFAHTETEAWETLLTALINAGWCVTASWPIDTEMSNRVLSQRQNTLASSVHLVCRPREIANGKVKHEVGDWREVLVELPLRIHKWLPQLEREGVVGADAIFSCLGPAMEIYSRYDSVEKASGELVTVREYLEQVWAAVSHEALAMIFDGADTTGFESDARLTAIWLWTLTARQSVNGNGTDHVLDISDEDGHGTQSNGAAGTLMLEYDAARKIAQGIGAYLERLTHLVEIKGNQARLLPVSERASYLFGKDAGKLPAQPRYGMRQMGLFEVLDEAEAHEWLFDEHKSEYDVGHTTLDRLHQAMILHATGRAEALKRFLVDDENGVNPHFWRLADALLRLYSKSSEEYRWLDGLLARKKGLGF